MDVAGLDDLLRRARGRDPDALSRLVAVYSERVFGLLYRLTGSRDVAEDLLQETFLRVVRSIEDYEHTGRFESWLFRIAANLARDRARRHGRPPVASIDDVDVDAGRLVPAGDNPAERVADGDERRRLEAALARLPDLDREVIALRHYSELPFREIAELLGVPLGTALARAHRALVHLRRELGEES